MDFREFVKILAKNYKLFLSVVLTVVILAFLWEAYRPVKFETVLSINIARSGHEEAQDYQYDQYYRLLADEKFVDTVANWLASPAVVKNTLEGADFSSPNMTGKKLGRFFKMDKLYPQSVRVFYATTQTETSVKIARSLKNELDKETAALNESGKTIPWFALVFDDPVVYKKEGGGLKLFLFSLGLGIFLALWTVFLRHYFKT